MSFFKNVVTKSIAMMTAVVMGVTAFPVTGFAMETNVSNVGYKDDKFVVVVDPGHDDKHHGAFSNSGQTWEEVYNLVIAKALYERLKEDPDIEVYMTRETGDCPNPTASSAGGDNSSRVTFAKSVNCDLYVACHLNSNTKTDANGASVYYPNNSYDKYINKIGSLVSKNILSKLTDLGLASFGGGIITKNSQTNTLYPDGSIADYYTIIKNSKEYGFTGIIVEHAFLSNPGDWQNYLSTPEKLAELGLADAEGILESINDMFDLIREREAKIEEQKALENSKKTFMFDPEYYWENNKDIQPFIAKNDTDGLLAHFENYGKDEGRASSPTFDVKSYLLANPDLRRAYGANNWRAYFNHYEKYGYNEPRRLFNGVVSMIGAITTYEDKDYSPIYNYREFVENYPELKKKYQYDDAGALEYFVKEGMKLGLSGSSSFDLTSYYNNYSDLRSVFGNNWEGYYRHYLDYGKKEGRVATGVTELKGYATVFNDVDYKLVYDFNYYIETYPDLRAFFGRNDAGALSHFVNFGIKEGRKSSPTFDLSYYKNKYSDLRSVFGDNNELYIKHYLEYGHKEGREAVKPATTTPSQPVVEKEELPYGEDKMYTIMGKTSPLCTVEAMVKYYKSKATYPSYYAENNLDLPTIEEFCQAYLDECEAEGVKAEVAFTQAMLETNFLKYTGDVRIEKLNFAGLGAVDSNPTDGAAVFPDMLTGIRAQVQHLKVYATKEELNNPCVDPRYEFVKGKPAEGSSIYVEYLGQKENPKGYGWATGKLYGFNIMTWMRNWLKV